MSKLISAKEARKNMNMYKGVYVPEDNYEFVYNLIRKQSEQGDSCITMDLYDIDSDKLIPILESKGYNVTINSTNITISWTDIDDEDKLIKDITNVNESLVGNIYKIQSYITDYSDEYTLGYNFSISTIVPHMIIGINHDETNNTVDLMQLVTPRYFRFNNRDSINLGNYYYSDIHDYISGKHPQGYSVKIKKYMRSMTEKYRKPDGVSERTGMLDKRRTRCKILNPVELFGSRALDVFHPDYSDLDERYGDIYEAFLKDPKNRICYHDLDMKKAIWHWTNSCSAFNSANSLALCFYVDTDGSCNIRRRQPRYWRGARD